MPGMSPCAVGMGDADSGQGDSRAASRGDTGTAWWGRFDPGLCRAPATDEGDGEGVGIWDAPGAEVGDRPGCAGGVAGAERSRTGRVFVGVGVTVL